MREKRPWLALLTVAGRREIALYLRVSSEGSETIEIQRSSERILPLYKWKVAAYTLTTALSAHVRCTRARRQAALRDAGNGRFGVVLVYKLERLADRAGHRGRPHRLDSLGASLRLRL